MQYLILIAIIGAGIYFRFYLIKKAENLATKEDIEEITTKVESLKAAVGSQQFIHQTRYQNEFNILLELSQKLIEMRDAALRLRPAIDSHDPNESENDRKIRRLNEYFEKARDLYRSYETKQPFYPDEIYQCIKKLDRVVWKEAVQYKNRAPSSGERLASGGYDPKYWDNAEVNAKEISEVTNELIDLIRNRVKYWENFEFKGMSNGGT